MRVMKANPWIIWMLLVLFVSIRTYAQSIERWLSIPLKKQMFQAMPALSWEALSSSNSEAIEINPKDLDQTIDGFGYTLTGGSAHLIQSQATPIKKELLLELFGKSNNRLGLSIIRISIGASDLDEKVFSYNDLGPGETDLTLSRFSLEEDKKALIPLLKEILKINPEIKILATPWSPPVWMKDNHSSQGGQLLPKYYRVYARYFLKYIQEMKKQGITIYAVTPQNEPLHPGNNPSLYMPAEEQLIFIRDHLGPTFKNKGIKTKIICFDHNCDHPDYPIHILNDPKASQYIDGSAFHLYNGDISALAQVRTKHPNKNLYFTEQWTGAKGEFAGDFMWHIKNVVIGALNQGSKTALEWNLANNRQLGPHTPGGCTECLGALTISDQIERNVAYYILAQASRFIPANSQRIKLKQVPGLAYVAVKRPDNKISLLVQNEDKESKQLSIKYLHKAVKLDLPASSVSTFIFKL